jgi:cytochrome c oxidase subunit 2
MVDSNVVLAGQTTAYTCYVLAIMAVMGWFAYRVTRNGNNKEIKQGLFYAFVTMLVIVGVSLHIVTHETIPWKPMDLNRAEIKADREFTLSVSDHKFILPSEKLIIRKNEIVRFNVTSDDLTYGFGLFRKDNSMVFQMQVLPGHNNDILWQFDKPDVYSIRSTEYSGWKGINMIVRDAVEVTE